MAAGRTVSGRRSPRPRRTPRLAAPDIPRLGPPPSARARCARRAPAGPPGTGGSRRRAPPDPHGLRAHRRHQHRHCRVGAGRLAAHPLRSCGREQLAAEAGCAHRDRGSAGLQVLVQPCHRPFVHLAVGTSMNGRAPRASPSRNRPRSARRPAGGGVKSRSPTCRRAGRAARGRRVRRASRHRSRTR